MDRQDVDNLMFCSEEPGGTFRLQKNAVYELQSVKFTTTFKDEHGGKVSTNTACLHKAIYELQKKFQ